MSSNIITGSSVAGPARLVTGANATLTRRDFAVSIATGGSNRTATLPNINTMRNRWYLIKVAPSSANNVTVTPAAGQTIDGASSLVLSLASNAYSSVLLYAPGTGTDWFVGPGPVELADPVISGDILFTPEVNHSIGVEASTTPAADGGDLTEFAGDGAIASGAAPGGDGGDLTLLAGNGGAGLAAQTGGPGGASSLLGGDGGDGTAAAAAGPGGDVDILGGDGGTDNGGGGGNGGTVNIDGGNATGAGQDGSVNLGTNGTTAIVRVGSPSAQLIVNTINQEFSNASNHVIQNIQSSPAGTVGRDLSVKGGQGADADNALGGAQGGSGQTIGGRGGNGSGTQIAGQGGTAALTGGDAGPDGGAGGNIGGDANVDAGAGSGAGVGGDVNIGTSSAENINIGKAATPVNILGNTQDVRASRLQVSASPDALLTTDYFVEYAGGGTITVNLPPLASVRGRSFLIVAENGGTAAVLTAAGGELISGPLSVAATFTLDAAGGGTYQSCILFAPQTGTNWQIVSATFLA